MRARALTALALGAAVTAVAALGIASSAPAGGPQPVKDGRYSGGAKRVFVFFDVNNRTIPFARVYSLQLQACTGLGGPAIFDSDTIDNQGRFALRDDSTHADSIFRLTGRFTGKTKVEGNLRWETTDNCPAGTYKFKYNARRHAKVP